MGHLLTLVHGTWPDPHGWVSARSFLRRELTSHLGDVVFQEFHWAGSNTHTARVEGGAALAEFINASRDRHPNGHHFIIAHSHGGNVALYAMRDAAAREAVDGIITLATPFLSARPRHLRHAKLVAWVVLVIGALGAFTPILALDMPQLLPVWLIVCVVAIDRSSRALTAWLTKTATSIQDEIVPAYQPPSVDARRLLVVAPRGDEAGRWLHACEVVAAAPFVIGSLLFLFAQLSFQSNGVALLNGIAKSISGRGLDAMRLFGLDGWSLAMAFVAICAIWAAVLLMASSVMRWPGYWREPLLANILVRIGSHTVPATASGWNHPAYIFEVPPEPLLRRLVSGRLRHSAICEQPAVVTAIGDWIRDGSRPT